jgi:predicted ArsR family transcriptional regulator
MRSKKDDVNSPLAGVLAHPNRARILGALVGIPRSATEISKLLELPRSTVGEQLQRLKSEGFVEEVAERGKRGAVERLFSATRSGRIVGPEEWLHLRPDEKRSLILSVIRTLRTWIVAAVDWNAGDFSADSHWVISLHKIDDRGWSELVAVQKKAMKEFERITSESAARLEGGLQSARSACSTFILFEMPDPPDDSPGL